MNTSKVLLAAANLIEERGWGQGDGPARPNNGLCLVDAIVWASPTYEAGDAAEAAMSDYLGEHNHVWNDAEGRMLEEVTSALRAAALIETVKESGGGEAYVIRTSPAHVMAAAARFKLPIFGIEGGMHTSPRVENGNTFVYCAAVGA